MFSIELVLEESEENTPILTFSSHRVPNVGETVIIDNGGYSVIDVLVHVSTEEIPAIRSYQLIVSAREL